MPWRMAPAWPFTPPPSTLTIALKWPSVPVTRKGIRTSDSLIGVAEVLFEAPAVDDDLALARQEPDAGDRGLAAAGSGVEGWTDHVDLAPRQANGSGRWA